MSEPIIDMVECGCCDVVQPSNEGMVENDNFICFACRKNYKIGKQQNWIALIDAQKLLIDDALDALKAMDVYDVRVAVQLRVVLDRQRHLCGYVNN